MLFYRRFLCMVILCTVILSVHAQKSDTTFKDPFSGIINTSATTLEHNKISINKLNSAVDSSGTRRLKTVLESADYHTQAKVLAKTIESKIALFDKGIFVKPGKLNIDLDYSYLHDPGGVALGPLYEINGVFDYALSYDLSLKNIPFSTSIKGANASYTLRSPALNNFFKFNFDPEIYRKTLLQNVLSKVQPEEVAKLTLSKINDIRSKYEKGLMSEVKKLQSEVQKQTGTILNLPDNISDLTTTDMATLKSKLLTTAELNNIQQSQQLLSNIADREEISKSFKDSIYRVATSNVRKLEALEKVMTAVTSWKQRFENDKTVAQLRNNLPFSQNGFSEFLTKPSNLDKVIKEHTNLSSVQSLFLSITKLDIGKNPVNGNLFDVNNVINTGINTGVKTKNLGLGFIQGKNNSVNQWLNAGLTSTITNEYSNLVGMQIGGGKNSSLNQSISLNYFGLKDQLNGLNPLGNFQTPMTLPMAAHKDAVLSIRTDIPLAANHLLSVDVSKSLGAYTNNFTGDSNYYKSNPYNNVLGSAGTANYAARLDYAGSFKHTDVTAFAKKVGLGYNNPGNSTLHNGENHFGVGVIQKFTKNRLTLKYNGDLKLQDFDPSSNYSFTTINNKVQASGQLNRFTKGSIIYQRTDYRSSMYGSAVVPGKSNRFQLNGSYRVKLFKSKLINNFTGMHQMFVLPAFSGNFYRSTSFLFSHVSSLVLKNNLLSITLMGNHSSSKDYLFNTSFYNVDANYAYNLNAIRLGSGLGFYNNVGWNQQIGAKQQVSAVLGNKFSLDMELGLKLAVKKIRDELANQFYATSHLRYNF